MGLQLLGPGVDDRVDVRRERGALNRDLPVALDEDEQDVLAAEALEEPSGGHVAIGILAAELGGELRLGAEIVPDGLHLVDGEARRARGRDAGARDLGGERPAERPGGGERGQHAEASAGGDCAPPESAGRPRARG